MCKFYSKYEKEIKKKIEMMLKDGMSESEILQVYLSKLEEILLEDKYKNVIKCDNIAKRDVK